MRRSTLRAAGLLTGTLALTAGGAYAGTDSVKDKAGDAAPAGDITKVTVRNAGKAVMIQTKLAKATSGRTHVVATMVPATDGAATAGAATYVARTVETGHKVGVTLESSAAPAADPTSTDPTSTVATLLDCHGMHAAVSSGRNGMVTIRIPQSCLGADAGTLAVDVATVTSAGEVVDTLPTDVVAEQG